MIKKYIGMDGKYVVISKMTTPHLLNAIPYFFGRLLVDNGLIKGMEDLGVVFEEYKDLQNKRLRAIEILGALLIEFAKRIKKGGKNGRT